jgi:predicted PurR-regulated permease PerM
MKTSGRMSRPLRVLVAAACITIIVIGMREASQVVAMFLLSGLLALAVLPLPNYMIRKGLSRGFAIAVTVLLVLVGGLATISLVGVSVAGLVVALPTYESHLTELTAAFEGFLRTRGIDPATIAPAALREPAKILSFAAGFFGGLANGLMYGLLLVLITIFMLVEMAGTSSSVERGELAEDHWRAQIDREMVEVRKYISITGWIGLITAIANYIFMLILGIDFAITWAFLSFLLNYIPNIGFILSIIPPVGLALLEFGWERALIALVGFFILNNVVEIVLKPRMMSKGLNLKPLLLILGLIFWSWVLGPAGAILAVPLTIAVRKLYERAAATQEAEAAGDA